MELKDVLFEVQDGVGIITMNRPDRLNASSTDMTGSMVEILENLTPDVRAIRCKSSALRGCWPRPNSQPS